MKRSYFPFFILGIGLFFTVLLTYYLSHQISEKDQLRFDAQTSQTRSTIENALDTYVTLLRASAGLMIASDEVTDQEFRTFVEKLDLRSRYPGVQGIGYSKKLESVDDLEGIFPTGEREEYHKIVFLEPADKRNLQAIGYDMFSEEVRREAMERARDTGLPAMTGKVTLVQEIDANIQAGFLIYVPVYDSDTIPLTVEARRELLRGFVYSPFRAGDFVNMILPQLENRLIEFAVFDSAEMNQEDLIYQTPSMAPLEHFYWTSRSQTIDLGGRQWHLLTVPSQHFIRTSERYVVPIIFFTGLLMSVGLFVLNFLQLRSQETKIEILEGITDGFISLNRKWKVTYVNQRGAAIFEKEPRDLLNNNFWNQIPSTIITECAHECKKAMIDRTARKIEAYFSQRNEWYVIRMYPSHHGLSLFFQDITTQKKLEDRKDEFISIASHELKTPLTSIRGFVQLVANKLQKDDLQPIPGYIDRIIVYIDRLNSLISELLDVSKIKAGKLELHLEQFPLRELVVEATESMQHLLHTHRLLIKGSMNETIIGDKQRLGQVLTNLLSNAVKYSPYGEKVEIHIVKQSTAFVIKVKDYGIGIKKSDQKKIFNRFYRSAKTPEEVTGLGIGLYVASEIVKYHGGHLSVSSIPGKGSTFSFTIPRHAKRKRTKKLRAQTEKLG